MKKSEFFVKSKKINLGFLVFVLVFYLSQPAFAISGDHQWQRVDETKYVDKYFEIDKNNGFQLHIFLPNGQKIGTVDNNGNINYQVNDYLGSPTIITNEQGQIVETNNYGDYGDIVNQNSSIDNNYKFTGKEQDSETNLQYFGARYYDNEAGRFVSIDPFTQKLQGLNYEKLSVFLADPQRLNSYSYASNDPINKIDFDGNLTMRALFNPKSTAAQLTFWHSGINTYLKPQGLNTTATFLEHSLSWYPDDIEISSSNQSQYGDVIDQIKGSSEYKNFINKQIEAFEKESRTSFSINDIRGSESLEFNSGDLSLAIGRVKIDEFTGYKNSQGNWMISTQFSDKYDFEIKTLPQEYQDSWFKTSANNAAYVSQRQGVITDYNININFTDEIDF